MQFETPPSSTGSDTIPYELFTQLSCSGMVDTYARLIGRKDQLKADKSMLMLSLSAEIKTLQVEIKELKSRLAHRNVVEVTSSISNAFLSNRVKDMLTTVGGLEEENSRLKRKLSVVQVELEEARGDHSRLESKMTGLCQDSFRLKRELFEMQNDKCRLEGELAEMRNDNSRLEAELAEVRSELAEVRNHNSRLEGELSSRMDEMWRQLQELQQSRRS
ncbi:hypothetical protein Poli38472_004290 [Pythium oligandrum]|uniref:Uncharacterized protein n=1 Tax=Pythium oligandrum TaxID=41045 RepID=A0A8K1FJX7_PYTOL|nr:hypothetical protein Poli38472_004290 [Pythium oligandrum]|eukprot:TMW66525.1 hypothetical protein Poli38472_004290 [Pythium oligandrum]